MVGVVVVTVLLRLCYSHCFFFIHFSVFCFCLPFCFAVGTVVMFGGSGGTHELDSTWIYYWSKKQWRQIPNANAFPNKAPQGRYHFGMASMGENKTLIFGGKSLKKGIFDLLQLTTFISSCIALLLLLIT